MHDDERPIPAHHCPLCGQPNQCAPAREGRFDVACWCSRVTIEPALLRRIPIEQQRKACVCADCAAAGLAATVVAPKQG